MNTYETNLNYDRYASQIGRNRVKVWQARQQHSARDPPLVADLLDPMLIYLESDEAKAISSDPMYAAWRETIESVGPHSHMFTICFKRAYADTQSIAALTDWATMMSRSIKGPRWKRKRNGLAGVAFAERHTLSLDFRGRLHFHVLIKDDNWLPSDEVLKKKAYEVALRLRDARGMAMTDSNRVDLRRIYDEAGVVGYLVKDINTIDWKGGDNIAFWDGRSGMNVFPFVPQSSRALIQRH